MRNHLRLIRTDQAQRAADLYAPILLPHHAAQHSGMGDLDGLFSKLHKKISKAFQKVFPAKTLLGKVLDPLGLTDPKRNLNLAGKVADVVGTAAAVVAGGWAIGAAAGATGGGFWATAGAGAKVVGAGAKLAGTKLLGAAKFIGGGIGTVAKSAAPLLLSGAFGGSKPAAEADAMGQPWPSIDPNATYPDGSYIDPGGYAGGGGGGPSSWQSIGQGEMPGATVPVEDEMPGPNWLLIGGIAAVAYFVFFNGKKVRK